MLFALVVATINPLSVVASRNGVAFGIAQRTRHNVAVAMSSTFSSVNVDSYVAPRAKIMLNLSVGIIHSYGQVVFTASGIENQYSRDFGGF